MADTLQVEIVTPEATAFSGEAREVGPSLREQLLDDPQITATHVRARAGVNCHEAVGVSEAPRGTLSHWVVDRKSGVWGKSADVGGRRMS